MARSESLDIETPDREALFASSEGVKWPTDSSHCSWIIQKAKVARSESLDIETPDREALFASSEGVKWPTDSSHCSWIIQKAKVARSRATKKKEWLRFLSKRSHSFLTYAFSFSS